MINLTDILFVNEAARTPEEALSKGVVALGKDELGSLPNVTLLSARRALAILTPWAKEFKGLEQGSSSRSDIEMVNTLAGKLSNSAIVGDVRYSVDRPGLYKVSTSSGVNKFGPLTYQLVMHEIYPSWLKSDSSLTNFSQAVWDKMYELSEKGVYERKFLGEFSRGGTWILNALSVNDDAMHMFENYSSDDYTEESLLQYAAENGFDVPGHFWAYRKRGAEAQVSVLFNTGEELKRKAASTFGLPEKVLEELITNTGHRFFSRMYEAERVEHE